VTHLRWKRRTLSATLNFRTSSSYGSGSSDYSAKRAPSMPCGSNRGRLRAIATGPLSPPCIWQLQDLAPTRIARELRNMQLDGRFEAFAPTRLGRAGDEPRDSSDENGEV
jgi:hypothetical protein